MSSKYDLGSVIGHIIFDYDSSGNKKAQADLDQTKKQADDFGKDLDKFSSDATGKLASVAKAFGTVAVSMAALNGGANLIVGIATEIGHLSGVAGLLPAVLSAGAIAVTSLTIGLQGFSQALSDAGNAQAFAADMKNLAPTAQDTAKAFQALRPALINLRLSDQEELFRGLSTEVTQLGKTYIPILTQGLDQMAGSLNLGAKNFATFAKNQDTISGLKVVLDDSSGAMKTLDGAIIPVFTALRQIGVAGAAYLDQLAGGAVGVAQKFADFINNASKTGKLSQWIGQGIDSVKQLGDIIGNVASILFNFFKDFSTGGAGLFNSLQALTGQLNQFVQSAAGAKDIKELGQIFGDIATTVRTVLFQALQELGPILTNLLPPFKQLVQQVGTTLINALKIVGPLLSGIAKFWQDNANTLNPFIIALAGGILALRGLSLAISGITAAVKTIQTVYSGITTVIGLFGKLSTGVQVAYNFISIQMSAIVSSIGSALSTAATQVGVWAIDFGAAFASAMSTAATAIGVWAIQVAEATANAVRSFITMAASAATNVASTVAAFVASIPQMVASMVAWVAETAVVIAAWVAEAAASVADMAIAVAATVIGWITMAAAAVAGAIVIAAAWIAANPIVLILAVLIAIVALIVTHWTQIVSFLTGVWDWIKSTAGAIWDWIKGVWETAIAAIVGYVTEQFESIKNTITTIINGIKNFFSSAASWLVNAGRDIISGLINGIESAVSKVWDTIKGIAGKIGSFFKGILGISSPSKVFMEYGENITQGLVIGMSRTTDNVAAASTQMAMASTAPIASNSISNSTSNSSNSIGAVTVQVAGNLDPTNPVAYRQAIKDITTSIRNVQREYA